MTREEAKQVFLNRGFVEVEGGTIYYPDKWREACIVISEWLEQEPCEDAISRQEAIDANCYNCSIKANGGKCSKCDAVKAIENLSSVNPQEKPGHWVEEIINIGSRKVFCSECGCSAPFEYVSNGDVYSASGYGVINKTKFCPNCGKRMIEPKESEVKE